MNVALARRLLLTALVVGAVAGFGTYSSFTATTTNTGNSFTTGSVAMGDNDSGSSMLSLSGAKASDSSTGCIKVTYTGSLSAAVHLYATLTGTVGQYLTLTVTRGTDSSPSFASCASFTADATNYIGAGAGVIYSGTLSSVGTTYAAGIADPTSSWAQNDAHTYRFTVSVQDDNSAQGLSGTAAFTWEARST